MGNFFDTDSDEQIQPKEPPKYDIWQKCSRFAAIGFLLALLTMTIVARLPQKKAERKIDKQIVFENEKKIELMRERELIIQDLELLRSDPEYNGKFARDRLNMYEPGETVIRFYEENEPDPTNSKIFVGSGEQYQYTPDG